MPYKFSFEDYYICFCCSQRRILGSFIVSHFFFWGQFGFGLMMIQILRPMFIFSPIFRSSSFAGSIAHKTSTRLVNESETKSKFLMIPRLFQSIPPRFFNEIPISIIFIFFLNFPQDPPSPLCLRRRKSRGFELCAPLAVITSYTSPHQLFLLLHLLSFTVPFFLISSVPPRNPVAYYELPSSICLEESWMGGGVVVRVRMSPVFRC